MNKIYRILIVILIAFSSCTEERDLSFLETVEAPSNVSLNYEITQDNTGLVTLTPSADSATGFYVDLGDGTSEVVELSLGENFSHTYEEGTYNVTVTGFNFKGDETAETQELVVSFNAPENLVTSITNNASVSKQVDVNAEADFATMYEFHSGEPDVDQPVATGNIGEAISYQYANAGIYDVEIVVKGGAIETSTYAETFEVTAILQPITSAPAPPNRNDSDVISIYGDAYTNVEGTDTFPDWGQGGQGSSWSEFSLNGDTMLQYTNLSYQGIQIGSSQDVTDMEFIHLDVWTTDVDQLETSLINIASDGSGTTEAPVVNDLTANGWTSIDIAISDYTDQGLTVNEILQLKFVGIPWAEGTVFIDNIYFYKSPSGVVTDIIEDFEGVAPAYVSFGNANATVVANPDMSGENTTSTVTQLDKPNGAEVWAGAFFDISTPVDNINYNKISVQSWSPKAGATVRFKIENSANPDEFYEVDAVTSATNAWEELVFDISPAANFTYDRVVLFYDFGVAGDGSTYYYDEITLVNDSGSGVALSLVLEDLEADAPVFTSFGNANVTVITNPDMSGENTSATVAELDKPNGAEVWAGTFFDITTPIDLNTYSTVTLKSWSPKSGAIVRFKIENSANPDEFYEVDALTSTTNAWEELVFDISPAVDFTYDRVVIFYDFDVAGDGTKYYFDEITLTN